MPKIINNIEYYSVAEIEEISGVNMRTLRRWIANGDLDHFLHAYQGRGLPIMYRLEPPSKDDIPVEGKRNTYHMPEAKEGDVDE